MRFLAKISYFWKAGSSSLLGLHRHKYNCLVPSSYCMSLNYHTPTNTHPKHGTAPVGLKRCERNKRRKRRVCVAHPPTPGRLNTAREAKSPIGVEANTAPIGSVALGPAENLAKVLLNPKQWVYLSFTSSRFTESKTSDFQGSYLRRPVNLPKSHKFPQLL